MTVFHSLYSIEQTTGVNRGTISRRCKALGLDTSQGVSEVDLQTVYEAIGYSPEAVPTSVVTDPLTPYVGNGLTRTNQVTPALFVETLTIQIICDSADVSAIQAQTSQIQALDGQTKNLIANARINQIKAMVDADKAQTENFLAQLGMAANQTIARAYGLTEDSPES